MTKRWQNHNLYQQKYKYHLPWYKAMWIVKEEDVLNIDGEDYKITSVKLASIRGSLPKITVEKI